MRKISANLIFPISSKPLKNGIITINDNGEILNIEDTKGNLKESENIEFYNGIIVPGFVNTHCHIELSHLKGKFPKHTGMTGFIDNIMKSRSYDKDIISKEIQKQDRLMYEKGIVAIGDISNTDDSLRIKKNSKIHYHTFIEVFSRKPEESKKIFTAALTLYTKFENGKKSIVPHSNYTVSKELFDEIRNFYSKNKTLFSIHNQEVISENQMFESKTGALYEKLLSISDNFLDFLPTKQSSFSSVSHLFPQNNKMIFVHNTHTRAKDIELANKLFKDVYWSFCVKSNMYIENNIPDINLFHTKNQNITLGTDSLASNDELSILEEIKIISEKYNYNLELILKWATLNGAKALNIEK